MFLKKILISMIRSSRTNQPANSSVKKLRNIKIEEEENAYLHADIKCEDNHDSTSKYFISDKKITVVASNAKNLNNFDTNIKFEKSSPNISLLKEEEEEMPNNKKLKWEPPNWLEQIEKIRLMREKQPAPVDTMGCDALSSVDPQISESVHKFQICIFFKNFLFTQDK
jgi:hypothetical protein